VAFAGDEKIYKIRITFTQFPRFLLVYGLRASNLLMSRHFRATDKTGYCALKFQR